MAVRMSWREIRYIAQVVSKKGTCHAGHDVGDTFEINTHKTGNICGFCYHDLFPVLMTLVMGGKVPWVKDVNEFVYECPDKLNLVTFKLVRDEADKIDPPSHPRMKPHRNTNECE